MEGPHLEMRTDDGVLDATVLTIEQNIFVFLCIVYVYDVRYVVYEEWYKYL